MGGPATTKRLGVVTSTDRMTVLRQRKAEGKICLTAVAVRTDLVDLLLEAKQLAEWDADDDAKVAAAFQNFITDLCSL